MEDYDQELLGYTLDNCVSCCADCNYAKKHMPIGHFLKWINRLAKFRNKHDN